MKLPGTISISRTTSNVDGESVRITLEDGMSHCRFVEVRLSVEAFGLAITGRSDVDCEITLRENAPIGKCREHKYELVPAPSGWKIDIAEAAFLLVPFEVDGWKGSRDDLYNHQNSRKGPNGESMKQVGFVRYVDPKEGEINDDKL